MDGFSIVLAIGNIVLATIAILQYSQIKKPILQCKIIGELNFDKIQREPEQNPQELIVSNYSENIARHMQIYIHIHSKDKRININRIERLHHLNPYESVSFPVNFDELYLAYPDKFKKIKLKTTCEVPAPEKITPKEPLSLSMDVLVKWGLFNHLTDSFVISWEIYQQEKHHYYNSNLIATNMRNGHVISKIEPKEDNQKKFGM